MTTEEGNTKTSKAIGVDYLLSRCCTGSGLLAEGVDVKFLGDAN